MFPGFYILTLAALVTACKPGKYLNPECSQWSEWTGDCKNDLCGHCSVQTRNRTALNANCTLPLVDTRQCYNLACVPHVPQVENCKAGCLPDCQLEFLQNGQARCKINGTTINPTKDVYNATDSIQHDGKTCHPEMLSCGGWREWSGSCQKEFCGQCNVQSRTRENIKDCKKTVEIRQCLNLACRESTQPACFSGTGCLPKCEWIQLNETYADGQFNGQARCKLPGSVIDNTIDDYQCWEGTTDSVHNTTCHHDLPKPPCSPWTEWTGDCQTNLCGQCNVQNRTRINNNGCKTPLIETRQCLNLACRESTQPTCFSGTGCLPKCDWIQLNETYADGGFSGQARCKVAGTTIDITIDDYQLWMGTKDTVHMTTCHPDLGKTCGDWTEWTGDCQTKFCGQCNVQKRTRENTDNCKQPSETRQCLNLACRESTQPTCFSGTGCLPQCEWIQLNETYADGGFNGQARCKVPGTTIDTTIDDYQIWMGSKDTVHMTACHPQLPKPDCSPWSEWSGLCREDLCGHCSAQTRSRTANNNKCTKITDSRQCFNLACVPHVTQVANCKAGCLPECELEVLPNGQARCKLLGTTIDATKDNYMIFKNKPDSIQIPPKTCHPSMISCGDWTEWSGDCESQYCGICNVQTRTRKNINDCKTPTETRQCLNLACRQSTQPNCFTGKGCAANCDWEVLNGTYLDGRFLNQARCKLPGSSIIVGFDDYQYWQNTTESEPGKICHPSLKQCGDWTEWSGDCQTQYCGICNVQTRTRTNMNKCPGPLTDTRQCLNLACRQSTQPNCFTGKGCAANCDWEVLNGTYLDGRFMNQARCKLPGSSIIVGFDDYQYWQNTTESEPGKICHPSLKQCGDWTEWSGDCQTQYCGHCNIQTRTRTNMNKCPGPLTDTRQCLNLACRATTQPECFSGSGCIPSCQFIQLEADYAGGKFTGQARCKTLGSTVNVGVDDYQLWMGTLETIHSKTCSPQLPKVCGAWTEWAGDCQYGFCGQCNVQTRTRTNINNCKLPLSELRQCLNLSCRQSTQPTCFSGTGCIASCEFMTLNETYGGGGYKGQGRCRLPGKSLTDLDDYQLWTGQKFTVAGSKCHPKMTASG